MDAACLAMASSKHLMNGSVHWNAAFIPKIFCGRTASAAALSGIMFCAD